MYAETDLELVPLFTSRLLPGTNTPTPAGRGVTNDTTVHARGEARGARRLRGEEALEYHEWRRRLSGGKNGGGLGTLEVPRSEFIVRRVPLVADDIVVVAVVGVVGGAPTVCRCRCCGCRGGGGGGGTDENSERW